MYVKEMISWKEKPKVSIIVPIYNAEKSLRRCIDSIVNQTLKEWELILVDDGSNDNSFNICNEYCRRDIRIKAIHKNNTGVSDTRNIGVMNSTGEYIAFVDSDDYVEMSMYEDMYNNAVRYGCDIVYCGFKYVNGNGVLIKEVSYDEYLAESREMVIEKIFVPTIFTGGYTPGPCNKIYKKDILISGSLFPINMRSAEDWVFNIKVLSKAKAVKVLNKSYYLYVKNDKSITHSFRYPDDPTIKKYTLLDEVRDICIEAGIPEQYYANQIEFLKIKSVLEYAFSLCDYRNKRDNLIQVIKKIIRFRNNNSIVKARSQIRLSEYNQKSKITCLVVKYKSLLTIFAIFIYVAFRIKYFKKVLRKRYPKYRLVNNKM